MLDQAITLIILVDDVHSLVDHDLYPIARVQSCENKLLIKVGTLSSTHPHA